MLRFAPTCTLLAACLIGCGGPSEPSSDEPIGEATSALTVDDALSTCTTTSVKGLSEQIVAEADCIAPGAFDLVPDQPNLNLGGAVFPYLEMPARDSFVTALQQNGGMTMTVNSMLRTVAQQYLLYTWYVNGQCGIGLAAKPGNSNHETGLAFDVQEHDAWKSALTANGFQWFGAADPVHYDYVGAGAVNHKGDDVLAFQKLWNANNPNDMIAEDGAYGPETESRLRMAPADGFPMMPMCGPPPPPPVDLHNAARTPLHEESGPATSSSSSSSSSTGGAPAEDPSGANGGCSCRAGSNREGSAFAPAIALVIALLVRRRRASHLLD